jgi:hypothetical protein
MLAKTRNFLLFGSFAIVVLGVALVTILNKTQSTTSSEPDVRARAATTNALQVNATVMSVDAGKGTLAVSDLYFADNSRSGEAKNFGNWTVTAPANFNFTTVSTGMNIAIGVDSKTFLTTAHTLTAVTIVPGTK